MSLEIIYSTYMYKKDLTFNNLQLFIYNKTKSNQNIIIIIIIIGSYLIVKFTNKLNPNNY